MKRKGFSENDESYLFSIDGFNGSRDNKAIPWKKPGISTTSRRLEHFDQFQNLKLEQLGEKSRYTEFLQHQQTSSLHIQVLYKYFTTYLPNIGEMECYGFRKDNSRWLSCIRVPWKKYLLTILYEVGKKKKNQTMVSVSTTLGGGSFEKLVFNHSKPSRQLSNLKIHF